MGKRLRMNLDDFFLLLETGKLRAALKIDGQWVAQIEVKQKILEAFKEGSLILKDGFIDKHNLFPRIFSLKDGIRLVPGGSSIRRGAYLAPGVVVMPPSYVNVGAFVDEGTMIDSHVLVGSCAQIGKRVHLSAGVQIGGVLEPIGQKPVVIEDDVFIGAGSVIVEGINVRSGAVIAPGVILSKAVQIYDVVNNCLLDRGADVPENAVVVPVSRKIKSEQSIVHEYNLSLSCPIIIKYRDAKTNAALTLEEALR